MSHQYITPLYNKYTLIIAFIWNHCGRFLTQQALYLKGEYKVLPLNGENKVNTFLIN